MLDIVAALPLLGLRGRPGAPRAILQLPKVKVLVTRQTLGCQLISTGFEVLADPLVFINIF